MSDALLPNGAAVAFENVTVALGGITILDGFTARVPIRSCTAIVGPNGAGKTTLLLTLLGQVPHQGRIHVACNPQERHSRIGYVPQRLQFDRGLPMTVLEFMVMGWQRIPLCLGIRENHRKQAMTLLASVKADALAKRKIGAISGGEMQRVLLALAVGQKPDLLILDEPAAGVDVQGEQVFCELLEGLRRELGFTQLMVSHDLATVTHHATHVICLNRRVVAEGPPQDVLTPENLTAIFGLHMGLVDGRALPDPRAECSASCCKEGHKHA
jgi:zinc transport system ATP-binding protein